MTKDQIVSHFLQTKDISEREKVKWAKEQILLVVSIPSVEKAKCSIYNILQPILSKCYSHVNIPSKVLRQRLGVLCMAQLTKSNNMPARSEPSLNYIYILTQKVNLISGRPK